MNHKKTQLCVNADDFGFSTEISRGIIQLMDRGLVSSASVMPVHCTTGDWKKLSEQKNISVGLHFSLTSGCNRFSENSINQYALAGKVIAGKIKPQNILDELVFQYETLKKNFSGEVSHFDTHHHIHILPAVARALTKLSAEKKIPYIRIAKEVSPGVSLKKILFNYSHVKNNKQIPVFGLNMMGKTFTQQNILKHFEFLKRKNAGKAIWIVHPGYKSEEGTDFSDSYNQEREKEIKTFLEMEDKIFDFADVVPLTKLL